MTKQEAFNIVCEKLAEQKYKSSDEGSCLYRGPEGRKCGVGWLIPDDEYRIDFDNSTFFNIDTVIKASPTLSSIPDGYSFLGDIQEAHDDSYGLAEVQEYFRYLAKEHGLVPDKVDLFTEWGE